MRDYFDRLTDNAKHLINAALIAAQTVRNPLPTMPKTIANELVELNMSDASLRSKIAARLARINAHTVIQ